MNILAETQKTNTEGGSFAEIQPEEEKPRPQTPTEEETVFTYLKQIVKALEAKEAQVAHHLDRIAIALEKIAKIEKDKEDIKKVPSEQMNVPVVKPSVSIPTPSPLSTPVPVPTVSSNEDAVKSAFPKELEVLLYFEGKDNVVKIKPRQYLGSENFAKIASIVRSIGGEYVSAGKDSHFRVVQKK